MSKKVIKMPKNHQNDEDADDSAAIFDHIPIAKQTFMDGCSSIIKSVNNDLKASMKNEIVNSEITQQIEDFVNQEDVKSNLKIKREKYTKRVHAYETTQEKLRKDREECISNLQKNFHLFDDFMKSLSNQNIE